MTDDRELQTLADRLELRGLADTYATAVDHRDASLFVSVFHPDAVLVVHPPGDPDAISGTMTGHDELAGVTEKIARYQRTYHFVGNARYELDGDRATGEVYGIAHHLTPDHHGGTDFVMLIRYLDTYSRGGDGWRIDQRRVVTDWTEVRTALRA
jgi:ketosteroid isomerase-like protein